MNIGIIGYGVIGKAVGDTFTSGKVFVNDKREITEKESNVVLTDSLPSLLNEDLEVVFICVPSPTVEGRIDTSYIVSVLDEIREAKIEEMPTVILKSTVPPNVLKEFFNEYGDVLSGYNPEFLRQNRAKDDLLEIEKHYVYAVSNTDYNAFENYIQNSNCNKEIIRFQSHEELSLLKYAANSFNATRVIFSNCIRQLFEQSDSEGMSYESFVSIFADFLEINKKRWGHNLSVPGPDGNFGYGGACLPKDVKALIEYADISGCEESSDFFNMVEDVNNRLRNE